MSQLMNALYRFTFETFTLEWVKQKRNIMEFNQFLDDIYGMQTKKQIPVILDKFNGKWGILAYF